MQGIWMVPLKFLPGDIVQTSGCKDAFDKTGESPLVFLLRHVQGDWGEVDSLDKRVNDDALRHGTRILSVYHLSDGTTIWIITEADRSSTCFLLPEEY
jgi:hypothetical protein